MDFCDGFISFYFIFFLRLIMEIIELTKFMILTLQRLLKVHLILIKGQLPLLSIIKRDMA